ncbi:CLEC17A [Mytilus edulis]|uniref:CLEC17A n=1 Tax=Mytilus edulis TaxID=6550 RepID=A0A8S3VCN2_MYTED|nr:CLEC17A [Mytilus edulis]
MNVVKHNFDITKNRRILPSSTSVIKQITLSPIECALLCSLEETCCYASYDRITNHCYLDGSCCPQNESSVDALMLKKNTVSLSCPTRWLKYENKCFYFSGGRKTWNEARLTCKNDGSRLVEVGSSCENDFLKMTAIAYGQMYWLGGSDIQNEGSWIWASSLTQFTFTDWSPTEPSNGTGENCVRMWSYWMDTPCNRNVRFICEKSFIDLPMNIKTSDTFDDT